MPIIKVREQQPTATGFQAILELDGTEYQIEITDPFTPAEEQRLEWYFEEWLMFPLIDKVKAEQAKESVNSYGRRLFEQVFKSNIDAYAEYRQLRNNLSQVQIEIVGKTPEFQALHWEAMQDPDLPRPLAYEIYIEFDGRDEVAETYHQLGVLAQELQEWEEAKHNYQLALEIFIDYRDNENCAKIYHLIPHPFSAFGLLQVLIKKWTQLDSNQ